MIEKIAGLWLVFCFGNLLADIGIVLFAITAYKISKASSNYSNELIRRAGEVAEAAVPGPEVQPRPENYEERGNSEGTEPYIPPRFVPPPLPPELGRWETWQKYSLILFVIGIAIQIIALIYSAS